MEYRDYYKILGVDKKATAAEIKKAFRAMAVKYHPDKNPDNKEAEEKFKLANEANEVLGNPEKRKKYDTLGENWQQNYQREKTSGSNTSQQQQYDSRNQGDPIDGFSDFSDFFEQIFGNGPKSGGRSQARKGADYETTLEITLEDAFAGTSKIIQLDAEKIRMTIKPGVAQDQVLKIKGKGAAGASKELNGDLYAKINIRPHHYFTRKGNDLYATQTIDLYTAVLGGEFLVRTINGQVKMNVAEGTQNGKSLRLKGKGMPAYDAANVFGDLYIQLQIQTPDKLSPKQRELFTQLKNTQ